MGELSIILLIVLILFGATRLPKLGEGVGKAISGLRRGLHPGDAEPASEDGARPSLERGPDPTGQATAASREDAVPHRPPSG